jgi:hypothetical protein
MRRSGGVPETGDRARGGGGKRHSCDGGGDRSGPDDPCGEQAPAIGTSGAPACMVEILIARFAADL